MAEVVVSMKDIQKRFPGVHALDDAQIELKKGEVHGLVGENGAGKSTLMKVLTGIYEKDSGTVMVKGREVHYRTPVDALGDGISMIHQELNLMPHLTVADNIFIGREPKKGLTLDKKKTNQMTRELLQSLNLDIEPDTTVGRLTVAKQQMIEIAKAISLNADILIMDEPTSGLDPVVRDEVLDLFYDFMQEDSHAILLSSHITSDLDKIADHITFIHQGRVLLSEPRDELLDTFGVLRCTAEQLSALEPSAVRAKRIGAFGCEALVRRGSVPANWPVEAANIEQIMLFLTRGEETR